MVSKRRQAIIWINAYTIHWRMHVALGDNELTLQTVVFLQYVVMKYVKSHYKNFIQLTMISTLSNIYTKGLVHDEIELCSSAES